MSRSLAILLLAAPLLAQTTVHLRYGAGSTGVGYAEPTGLTNASPPVLTVAADPGWSDGDDIMISGMLISGPLPSPINGRRFVDRLTATTYALYNDSGLTSAATAPGVYLGSTNEWAGAVGISATIPADPLARLLKPETIRAIRCDVDGGCLTNIVVSGGTATANFAVAHVFATGKPIGVWGSATTALNTSTGSVLVTVVNSTTITWATAAANGTYTDAAVSAWAHSANPAWTAMGTACGNVTTPRTPNEDGSGMEGGQHEACAIRFYVDRSDTTARDKADQLIDYPEDISYGTFACNESASYCNGRGGAVDYSRERLMVFAHTLAFRRAAGLTVSSTSRDKLLNNNQLSGSSCTNPAPVDIGAVSLSGTTLTGTGFTSSLAAGGSYWIGTQIYEPNVIVSVTNDTTAVVRTSGSGSGTGLYVRPWQSGDCGALYLTRHHEHSQLGDQLISGGTIKQVTSTANFYHNLSITSAGAEVMLNAVLADVDTRAKDALEQAWSLSWDTVTGVSISSFGGGSSMGSAYDIQRGYFPTLYVGAGQLISGTTMVGDWAATPWQYLHYGWNNGLFNSGRGYASFYGEGTTNPNANAMSRTARVMQWASTNEKRYFLELVRQGCGGSVAASCFADNQYYGAAAWFLGYDVQLEPLAWTGLPTATFLRNTNGPDLCPGAKWCKPHKYEMFMTRDSWDASALRGQVITGTYETDHVTEMAGKEQWWFESRSGPTTQCFICSDSASGAYWAAGHLAGYNVNNVLIPGGHSRKATQPAPTATYRGSRANVAHLRADTKDSYTVSPTRADRDFVHFKNTEALTVTRTSFAGSSGVTYTRTHYANNGQANEGTTTCEGSGCDAATALTAKIYSSDTVRRVISQSVFPVASAPGIRLVDDADGGYPNDFGNTFALKHCASSNGTSCTAATALTAIEVRRVAGLSDTALTLTAFNPSAAWDGVQADTGTTVRVAMFATSAQTSMPAITSTATAEFFAMPFAPGTYTVFSGGTPVCSSLTVTAADGAIHCASVPAGAITVGNQPPPSPGTSIRGGAIRGGVVR